MNNPNAMTLIAPLSGPLVPLERVPDPVFAQKMVGDGISIDPVDQCLRAPATARWSNCTRPATPSPSPPRKGSKC